MARIELSRSPPDVPELNEVTVLALVAFALAGVPMTLAQYVDALPNDDWLILAPMVIGPILVVAAYAYRSVERPALGYSLRLWFLLTGTTVGLSSVLYVVLGAIFGLP